MPRPVPPLGRAGAPVARAARRVAGLALGGLTGVAELGFLCVAGGLFAVLAARPAGRRAARRFAETGTARLLALEHARLTAWFDHDTGGWPGHGADARSGQGAGVRPGRGNGARSGFGSGGWSGRGTGGGPVRSGYGYLALRATFGTFASYLTFAGLFVGLLFLTGGVGELLSGASSPVPLRYPGVRLTVDSGPVGTAYGLVLLGLSALWGAATVAAERRLATYFADPGEREAMRRRIAELTATRSGIVRAVDDERRRIERDLHDGVQQRGVALGMLLGRARHGTDPAAVAALVNQAYAESRRLLDELRGVAWRVYPAALDELGLRAALAGVAEQAGVPVTVRYGLAERPVSEIETAVYFVAREAIANAAKHAGAGRVLVVLSEDEHAVTARISDDGRGGADPSGGGLSGLERRVLALDGAFEVDSPPGGPTRITATLPRGGSERPEPSCG